MFVGKSQNEPLRRTAYGILASPLRALFIAIARNMKNMITSTDASEAGESRSAGFGSSL